MFSNDPFLFNLVGGAWRSAWGGDPITGQVFPGNLSILTTMIGKDLGRAGFEFRIAPAPTWFGGIPGLFNPDSPTWGASPTFGFGTGGADFMLTGTPGIGGWTI